MELGISNLLGTMSSQIKIIFMSQFLWQWNPLVSSEPGEKLSNGNSSKEPHRLELEEIYNNYYEFVQGFWKR